MDDTTETSALSEITPVDDGPTEADIAVDEALLDATRISMLAEQSGIPLLPWQQRVIDLACIVDRTGARPLRPFAAWTTWKD